MLSWELKSESRASAALLCCAAHSSFIILNSSFPKSSGRSSTTIPELLHREPRLLGLMPLTTICRGPLAAGTTKPPGHMQKLYTPLPSTWVTKLYSATGRYLPRPLRLWYCIRSIREAGCSRRTPLKGGRTEGSGGLGRRPGPNARCGPAGRAYPVRRGTWPCTGCSAGSPRSSSS